MLSVLILICAVGAQTCTEDDAIDVIVLPERVVVCSIVPQEFLARIEPLLLEGQRAVVTCSAGRRV